MEAFDRLLDDECLSLYESETYAEGYEQVAKYMEFYNTTRMHSSLKFMAPEECYRAIQCRNRELPPVRVQCPKFGGRSVLVKMNKQYKRATSASGSQSNYLSS